MGHFKDEEDVYRFIGRLFEELAEDPELAPRFRSADTTVRYELHNPDAVITARLVPDEEIVVVCGPSDLEPEVVMSMDADTAHAFWMGKINLTGSLARGDIIAKGPVAKILRLVPLVKPSFLRYEQLIRAAGRDDLLA